MYLKPPNFSIILTLALSVYACVFYCMTVVLPMNIFLLFPRYFYFSTILYPLNSSTFVLEISCFYFCKIVWLIIKSHAIILSELPRSNSIGFWLPKFLLKLRCQFYYCFFKGYVFSILWLIWKLFNFNNLPAIFPTNIWNISYILIIFSRPLGWNATKLSFSNMFHMYHLCSALSNSIIVFFLISTMSIYFFNIHIVQHSDKILPYFLYFFKHSNAIFGPSVSFKLLMQLFVKKQTMQTKMGRRSKYGFLQNRHTAG